MARALRLSYHVGSRNVQTTAAPYSKRDWIYSGLAHPSGVMARRRRARRLVPGSRLALIGDEHAAGIAPFLRQLAVDGGLGFRVEAETGACLERWQQRYDALLDTRPTMVLASLASCSPMTEVLPVLRRMAQAAERAGTALVWVRPPDEKSAKPFRVLLRAARIPSFHSEALKVPCPIAGKPSARGYAGWAGALWRWLG
jgi:hypothetical protein